ncbi:PAG [Symbiodinium natans]|uniref:PAG protein n=1 Tax=Symbiodinium natans TaxID=878477 RepID=A0A812TLW8_9DINO|nr:PAG [Symbiodinium natans]
MLAWLRLRRRVLVIGGSFSGLAAGRDLANHFLVTIIDAKEPFAETEFFEYTPGVLRAYVKPKHLDALTFTLQPVIETRMGCKFIWGEVKELNGDEKTATYKPMFVSGRETIDFDYCLICAGCNFGPFHKWGESLWFPTIHEDARPEGSWPHLDERFLEGRRRHILEEFNFIKSLNDKSATILVVGAGFIGVEWVTELQHFFPRLKLTIIDFLPQPLGPLPANAAKYCEKYMNKVGIKQFYNTKYDAKDPEFWKKIDLPSGPDKEYVCIGVKASNYFMPKETLSEKGPGGGGWILMEQNLAVKTRDGKRWGADEKGFPRIYAVGDCNYSCVEEPGKKPNEWPIPPIPKISYPGEEMCIVACTNIEKTDRLLFQNKTVDCCGDPLKVADLHWPWGAGMFATSLGPDDACFVAGANWEKNSGLMCVWGQVCAVQKEVIEASKTDECAYGFIGRCIWYFVHHTPVHLFGGGPRWGY